MIRVGLVLLLIATIVGLATFEQIYIDKAFTRLEAEATAITQMVSQIPYKGEFDEETKERMANLHSWWQNKEHKMGVFIRHIDLSYISDAMIYAKNFIDFDNKEEAMAGLGRLNYLIDTYSTVYGLNGFNIL